MLEQNLIFKNCNLNTYSFLGNKGDYAEPYTCIDSVSTRQVLKMLCCYCVNNVVVVNVVVDVCYVLTFI